MMMAMGPYAQQIMQMYRNPERRAELGRGRHDGSRFSTQVNVTTVDCDVPGQSKNTEQSDIGSKRQDNKGTIDGLLIGSNSPPQT